MESPGWFPSRSAPSRAREWSSAASDLTFSGPDFAPFRATTTTTKDDGQSLVIPLSYSIVVDSVQLFSGYKDRQGTLGQEVLLLLIFRNVATVLFRAISTEARPARNERF